MDPLVHVAVPSQLPEELEVFLLSGTWQWLRLVRWLRSLGLLCGPLGVFKRVGRYSYQSGFKKRGYNIHVVFRNKNQCCCLIETETVDLLKVMTRETNGGIAVIVDTKHCV